MVGAGDATESISFNSTEEAPKSRAYHQACTFLLLGSGQAESSQLPEGVASCSNIQASVASI